MMPANLIKSGKVTESAWEEAKKIVAKQNKSVSNKWAEVVAIAEKITKARKKK
jgi:hypothetical protein